MHMSHAACCTLAWVINFFVLLGGPHMPGAYECTEFPTTHFPPIVPTFEDRDDVQCLMTLSLCHWYTSSRALCAV